ncbi:MAG: AsmA-like C-terminal region-containing protein [Gallionella sp.]|nr:AsmA-like C-terminal region-containing protein [Gallionella sp.]
MRLLKRILVGLLALLMLAMTAAYLIPLDTYVPEVERALGEQLHEPVSIKHLRMAMLPLPHLELQEVRLGGQEGIVARSINVEPDLPALLAGEVVMRRILVQGGTASLVQVRKLVESLAKAPATAQRVALRELQLSGMRLLIPGMTLGPIEGKLEFARAGELERAWFAMDEQKITAVLLPLPEQHFFVKAQAHAWASPQLLQLPLDDLLVEGVLGEQDFVAQKFAVAARGIHVSGSGKVEFSDGWRIQAALTQIDAPLEQVMALLEKPVELTGAISAKGALSGKAGTLGALKDNFRFSGEVLISHATARIAAGLRHPLVLDQIKARVAVQPEHLELNALEARLYGGKLSGKMSINRRDTVLAAEVAVNGIAMQSLVEALTNEVLFTGSMDGAAKFSMRLDEFERFPENMQLAGNFHLRNGVLTKVDLAQAASNLGKANTAGGTTRFDDLTGLLNVDASGYHFRKLKIVSGSLNAEGRVDVSPSLQLGGMLDTDVKGTAGLVSMPMVVSGTLNNPVVRPSKSALAGAAVGTAILGPGLGTAVGIKIGGFLNKLFGKNEDKSSNKNAPPKSPAKK